MGFFLNDCITYSTHFFGGLNVVSGTRTPTFDVETLRHPSYTRQHLASIRTIIIPFSPWKKDSHNFRVESNFSRFLHIHENSNRIVFTR
jgi:hypothetical protein